MIKSILMAGGLATYAGAAFAATISGDTFTLSGDIDFNTVELTAVSGVALGTSGGATCEYFSIAGNCDAASEVAEGGNPSAHVLTMDFTSNSAFEIGLSSGSGFGGHAVNVMISDLDFMNGPLTAAITGVTFNRRGSYLDTFLAGPGNPGGAYWSDPVISFTANSIAISWGDFDGQLLADGPRLAFNVTTEGTQPAPVPLPATAPFLVAGLAALGLRRRRRRR